MPVTCAATSTISSGSTVPVAVIVEGRSPRLTDPCEKPPAARRRRRFYSRRRPPITRPINTRMINAVRITDAFRYGNNRAVFARAGAAWSPDAAGFFPTIHTCVMRSAGRTQNLPATATIASLAVAAGCDGWAAPCRPPGKDLQTLQDLSPPPGR